MAIDPITLGEIIKSSTTVLQEAIRAIPQVLGYFSDRSKAKEIISKLEGELQRISQLAVLSSLHQNSLRHYTNCRTVQALLDKSKEHLSTALGASLYVGTDDHSLPDPRLVQQIKEELERSSSEIDRALVDLPSVFQIKTQEALDFMEFHAKRVGNRLAIAAEEFTTSCHNLQGEIHEIQVALSDDPKHAFRLLKQKRPLARYQSSLENLGIIQNILFESIYNQFFGSASPGIHPSFAKEQLQASVGKRRVS